MDIACVSGGASRDFLLPINNGGTDAKCWFERDVLPKWGFGEPGACCGQHDEQSNDKQESHRVLQADGVPARSVIGDRLSQTGAQSISSLCREVGLVVCRYLNFAEDISGLSCSSRPREQASTDRVVDLFQGAPVALRWSTQLRPRNMCPE